MFTEKIFILVNDFRHFNEIFRKDVTYDNIKIHKKPESHPLFRRLFFEKTTGMGGPPSHFRVNQYDFKCIWIIKFLTHCDDMLLQL